MPNPESFEPSSESPRNQIGSAEAPLNTPISTKHSTPPRRVLSSEEKKEITNLLAEHMRSRGAESQNGLGEGLRTYKAHLSSAYNCHPSQLHALHAQFTKKLVANEASTEVPPATQGHESGDNEPIATTDNEPNDSSAHYRTGPHADYTFHTKHLWRCAWENFLRDKLETLGKPVSEAKVICLPGKNPHSELELYLRLGFRPENILSVEGGDADSKREFTVNMEQLRAVHGDLRYEAARLEKVLPVLQERGQRFDVVSYDFHGPTSWSNARIMQDTPIASRCLVLINLLAAREKPEIQETLERVSRYVAHPQLPEKIKTFLQASNVRLNEHGFDLEEVNAKHKDKGIAAHRELATDYVALTQLGHWMPERVSMHRSKWDEVDALLEPIFAKLDEAERPTERMSHSVKLRETFAGFLCMFVTKINHALGNLRIHQEGGLRAPEGHAQYQLPIDTVFGTSKIREMERWSYSSEASTRHLPYFSSFAVIDTPLREYERWREPSKFFMNSLIKMFEFEVHNSAHTASLHFEVTDRAGRLIDSLNHVVQYRDEISLFYGSSRMKMPGIRVSNYLRAVAEYEDWIAQYPLDHHPIRIDEIPRRVVGE